MFRRTLLAGLASLVFTIGVMAELKSNEEHQFEANFPTKAQQLFKPLANGGKVIVLRSNDEARVFMVGTACVGDSVLNPEHTKLHAREFVAGATGNLKEVKVVKEGELKLNDETRTGYATIIQHEGGCHLYWVTIENGKIYFVSVQADCKEALKEQTVKLFLESVKIRKAEIAAQ